MSVSNVIEAEAVDPDTGEVLPARQMREPDALAEFSSDAGIGLERAKRVANQLRAIVDEKHLAVRIGNGEHLRVEAWCACGSMVGVTPKTEWSREVAREGGPVEGYTSRVSVIRVSTGELVGAAEADCYFDENEWSHKRKLFYHRWAQGCDGHEDRPRGPCANLPNRHAAKSMSQTRATSKALAQVLRWIPVIAGYKGTPAEEMHGVEVRDERPARRREAPPPPAPVKAADAPTGEPAWFDEALGFGKHRDKTWRVMCEGEYGNDRGRWGYLSWLSQNANDKQKQERAHACLAIYEVRRDARDTDALSHEDAAADEAFGE